LSFFGQLGQAVKKLTAKALQEVVGDFEKAVWRAVQDVFQGVTIKGCGFHWSQCLLRKIKTLA
jgi:2,4-dienoyl-CoA reductase-like NADH-dependent reductase (Old Yellow Enzyme family)